MYRVFLLLFIGIPAAGLSQILSSSHYTVNENLPSNFVKAVATDHHGFLWAGTDAGLARFDGTGFQSFNANLPSLKVKALLNSPSLGMLVLNDLGLCQIIMDGLTPVTRLIVPGSAELEDGKLNYPKTMFSDSHGCVWIGEATAISCWDGNILTRYPVESRFFNDSFSRAFSFFEDDNQGIYALSWGGYLLKFDAAGNRFTEVSMTIPEPVRRAYSAIRLSDNRVWFSTRSAIYELRLDEVNKGVVNPVPVVQVPSAHTLYAENDSVIWAGTIFNGVYRITNQSDGRQATRIPGISEVIINDIKVSPEGQVWIAQDEGVHLLHQQLFRELLPVQQGRSMRRLKKVDENRFLWLSHNEIRLVTDVVGNPDGTRLIAGEREVFDAVFAGEDLLISYRDGELTRRNQGRETTVVSSGRQSRLTNLTADPTNMVWGYDERNRFLFRIRPDGTYQQFGPTEGLLSGILCIIPANDGQLYLGSTGNNTFLYRWDPVREAIENISGRIQTTMKSPIEVYDLVAFSPDSILLATNHGLFSRQGTTFIRILPADSTETLVVRALELSPSGDLLAGTEKGVMVLSAGEWITLNMASGLPPIPLLNEGLICTRRNQLMVMNTRNIVWAPLGTTVNRTPRPAFTHLAGEPGPTSGTLESGEPIEIRFSSPVYPAMPVVYQYRIIGLQPDWKSVHTSGYLFFPGFGSGEYAIELRAQKPGSRWSEPTRLDLNFREYWYGSVWTLGSSGILVATGMLLSAYAIHRRRIRKAGEAKAELEAIVARRTEELELANRNKTDLIAIVSHELKNPLTAVIGFSEILRKTAAADSQLNRVNEIHLAASRMLRVINSLLESAALESGNRQLNRRDLSIPELVGRIVSMHEIALNRKSQQVHLDLPAGISWYADQQAMEEVMDNLLSNAIKYSPKETEITIRGWVDSQIIHVSVTDQGPGISPEKQENLFRRFGTLGSIPTGGEFSSGLGLSIAWDLVVMHGGTISVSTSPGGGSVFTVSLPDKVTA